MIPDHIPRFNQDLHIIFKSPSNRPELPAMARHVSEPVLVPWRLGFTVEQLRQLQMLVVVSGAFSAQMSLGKPGEFLGNRAKCWV